MKRPFLVLVITVLAFACAGGNATDRIRAGEETRIEVFDCLPCV